MSAPRRDVEGPRSDRVTTTGLVGDAGRYVVRSPALVLPFLVVALVVAGVEFLRRRGPVPVQTTSYSLATGFDVQSHIYPSALSQTTTPLNALVDLKPQYLAWVVGLELVTFLAVVVAGAVVVTRVTDSSLSLAGVVRYGAFVVALGLLPSVNFSGASIVVGLPLLVVAYYITVRLFAVPVFLVQGLGFRRAAGRSWAATDGRGWSVFGVLVLLGIGYSLTAVVPTVGPALSTAVFGTLHAVTLGLFVECTSSSTADAGLSSASATTPANP